MKMKGLIIFVLILASNAAYAGANSDLRQGSRLYKQGKYGQALNYYQQALSQEPDNQEALFNAGAAYYQLQDYEQAEKSFETAASLSGTRAQDSLFNLATAYYRAGNREKAIETYQKAILANMQDKEALHNLQIILQEKPPQNPKQNPQNPQNPQDQQNQDNQDNKDQQSPNQDSQEQQQKEGQTPREQERQQKDQNTLPKDDAERVLQMARENEFKPQQPGNQAQADNSVEKDW